MILPLTLLVLSVEPATKIGEPVAASFDAAEDERNPRHPRYDDCNPPKNFSKRFPKVTLKKAIKKSGGRIEYAKPGPLTRPNPVTGASVSSENAYGSAERGQTFAGLRQDLNGEKTYSIYTSNTNYSKISKVLILNELAEIYLPHGGTTKTIPLTAGSENGFCVGTGRDTLKQCFSTATAEFRVDKETFMGLANVDPAKPILVTSKRRDGEMSKCPLYYSPLSFKAPLMLIDAQYEKAEKKRKRQIAKGV